MFYANTSFIGRQAGPVVVVDVGLDDLRRIDSLEIPRSVATERIEWPGWIGYVRRR